MKALKTITCVLTFALLLILAPTQAKAVSNNVSATEGTFTVHQFIDGKEAGSLTIRAKGLTRRRTRLAVLETFNGMCIQVPARAKAHPL